MAKDDLDRYVAACTYPGVLDARCVEGHLRDYLAALGMKRDVVRLERDWRVAQHRPLQAMADEIARDARDAWAARDARDARAARDAWAARDARAARAARDAWDAWAARDAWAAWAARDAWAAWAARDARDAWAARDARDARDARTTWCVNWSAQQWDLSWLAVTQIGTSTDQVRAWSRPLFEAFIAGAGALCWTDDVLYWIAKPTVYVEGLPDGRRLHRADGPALVCDIEDLYFWRGVLVPRHWIEESANLDPNEVVKAGNVEQRAAGAAIVGWPKMLSVLKAKVVDDSGSPDVGQLIELTLPGLREPGRFLKATCPRNGVIVEGVPRVSDIDGLHIETALHAQAWRIGDPLSDYQHPPRRT